jgi:hypothetical protein
MESVGASSPSLIAMSELVLPPIDDIPRDDFCELNDEFTQFRIFGSQFVNAFAIKSRFTDLYLLDFWSGCDSVGHSRLRHTADAGPAKTRPLLAPDSAEASNPASFGSAGRLPSAADIVGAQQELLHLKLFAHFGQVPPWLDERIGEHCWYHQPYAERVNDIPWTVCVPSFGSTAPRWK